MNAVPDRATEPTRLPPMGLAGSTEAELRPWTDMVAGIARGDQRALEVFYRRSVGRVYGLALRITRQRELAEEVAEDVYVQIWHSASRYDAGRGAPLAWALTICRSRAIDALRRRDPAICDADPGERGDLLAPLHAPDLQDLAQATQSHVALHRAVAGLTAERRQLVSLAFFRDLSHAEIAAHIGMPLGTVKSQLRRTLAGLRQALGAA